MNRNVFAIETSISRFALVGAVVVAVVSVVAFAP
jgi:hypothetical protein